MADNTTAWASPRHRNSVIWVVALATLAIIFDGYDLVVYGTILPTLMADPTQIGAISAQQGGALGSYALIGVMDGALRSGACGMDDPLVHALAGLRNRQTEN